MSNILSLAGRRALVTGASRGLGRHFALTLAHAGARVALASRSPAALAEVALKASTLGPNAAVVALDVTDAGGVERAVADAAEKLEGLDILVNNAGIAVPKPALDLTEADWDATVDTDLKGAFLVAQAAARIMKEQARGGSIVNVASITAFWPAGQLAAYAAAKAGLVQLTRVLAREWARHAIRVNALAPGYIATDMNREFFASDAGKKLIQQIPQRTLGQPADLDGALLLLASEAGRHMTGAVITVDGGLSLT